MNIFERFIHLDLENYFISWSINGEWDDADFINCTYDIAEGKIHIIKAQSDWNLCTENVTQNRFYLSEKH